MKKAPLLIGALVIAVIVIIIATKKDTPNNLVNEDSEITEDVMQDEDDINEDNANERITGSFKNLIMSGKSYQCTFAKSDQMGDISGEVFVGGENFVRGSYQMIEPNGSQSDIEVLQDGEFNYVWGNSPLGAMALKTRIDDVDTPSNKDAANFLESDDEFDFDCKRWRKQDSKFVPPRDVDFNEFTIPTFDTSGGGVIPTGDLSTAEICSSCDSAPAGAAREQCLQALSAFGCS